MLLAAAVAATTLLVSACAGTKKDTGSPQGSTPASGGSGDITLGMITSLTGRLSVLGIDDKAIAQKIVDSTNAAGGVNGRQVKLIVEDDQSTPTAAVTALRTLMNQHITALIGPVFSSSCLAIAPIVQQAHIPTVMTCGSSKVVEPVQSYIFQSTPVSALSVPAIAARMIAAGQKKVALLADNTGYGMEGMTEWKAYASQHPNQIQLISTRQFDPSSSNFTPQLSGALDAKPDALVVWTSGAPQIAITKEYEQSGATVPLYFDPSAATDSFAKALGSSAPASLRVVSSAAVTWTEMDKSSAVYQLNKQLAAGFGGHMTEPLADACGATRVLLEGVAKGGTDAAKVRAALESTQIVGCSGTYNYSPTDHIGLGINDLVMSKLGGGYFQRVAGASS